MTIADQPEPAGQRRIVLHPRTASARRLDRSRVDGGHVRGYTIDTDEVLDYMREHRRLALRTFLPTMALLLTLLAVTVVWQQLGTAQIAGINVLWIILGPVTLLLLLVATVRHERHALRLEERWMDHRQ